LCGKAVDRRDEKPQLAKAKTDTGPIKELLEPSSRVMVAFFCESKEVFHVQPWL
jgi:hypothetical protein